MRRQVILLLTVLALLVTTAFSGCGTSVSADNGRLKIVTTCFPPYDFARAVTGDTADITMLLCPGAEAHSYEPTPLDIARIQNCDVFVYVGGEGEVWADKILDSLDTSDKTVIRLFDYVSPLEEEEVGGEHHHDHSHDHHDHDHGSEEEEEEYDEHIWTSPRNAMLCVDGVCQELCENASEDSRSLYQFNARAYVSRLEEIDREYTQLTENAPSDLIVVGDRFPFRYLANDYGLEYLAAFSGCSSETEPGIYTMALLIDETMEHSVDTVFYLEFSTKKLAEKLSAATGAQMLPLHSMHNVSGEDFSSGITCADLMENNLSSLKEALY